MGNLKNARARDHFTTFADHFAPIILVGKKNRKTIILVGVHFGGKGLYTHSVPVIVVKINLDTCDGGEW